MPDTGGSAEELAGDGARLAPCCASGRVRVAYESCVATTVSTQLLTPLEQRAHDVENLHGKGLA